jgi:hypothetical protein
MTRARWPFLEPARARSVAVQLGLLGVTFVGALGLAVVALCLRSLFFEKYVREIHAPPAENAEALVSRLEHPGPAEDRPRGLSVEVRLAADRRAAADWDALYGLWMSPIPGSPAEARVVKLLWSRPEATLARIRATSVVGNPDQRARALVLLSSVPASPVRKDAAGLCRFVRERARRRGEWSLFTRADQVYRALMPPT